jgi:hypothetical protein
MEGIWYAHFSTGSSQGNGLAVLRNGEILGGDPDHTYTGSYQEDGDLIYANVRVAPYTKSGHALDMNHPVSFFLTGSSAGDSAHVSGHPNNRPDVTVEVDLQKGV